MSISVPFDLTGCRRFFAEPATPRQRQYEALRAFFMEGLASAEVAREFTTRVGGLFLFVPDLIRLDSDALAATAKLPGSRMIPAGHALRAALALKLWSIERKSHVMALVADEGLALFCGLNAMPKKSFLSEYSSRITPRKVSRLLGLWHDQVTGEALVTGESLNLDFHSVPY